VDLQESFTHDDLQMAFLLASRGLDITVPGDPLSLAKELPPTVDTDVLPLGPPMFGSARGVKHIAAGIRRLSDWRRFFDIMVAAPEHTRAKLLTHSGHGSVLVLIADTPHAQNVSSEAARIMIRRITGAPALGRRQCGASAACPVCDTRGFAP
jgi:hypothetical protein